MKEVHEQRSVNYMKESVLSAKQKRSVVEQNLGGMQCRYHLPVLIAVSGGHLLHPHVRSV